MKIAINRVQVYKTSDGILIENREKFLAHERQLAFGDKVKALVESKVDALFSETSSPSKFLDKSEITQLIMDNADELRTILTGKVKIARKPRAKKPAPVQSVPAHERVASAMYAEAA